MSKASFKIEGALDSAGAPKRGTAVIDRDSGVIEIRPLHSRRTYRYILGDLCTMAIQAELRAEALSKKGKR